MWLLFVSVLVLFDTAGVAFCPADGLLGRSSPAATAVKAAHLLFLATSLGATIWAILVGGLVMFLHLPRHTMGSLRRMVFPVCFALNAARTAVTARGGVRLNSKILECYKRRQLALLVATIEFDLANLLLFTPKTLKERHIVERGLGIGNQNSLDGWRSNARAAMSDASLVAANRRFRAAHVPSAVALLASILRAGSPLEVPCGQACSVTLCMGTYDTCGQLEKFGLSPLSL
ncbi:hypothetical protein ACQ4PT_026158 [Festuca glaucescens]